MVFFGKPLCVATLAGFGEKRFVKTICCSNLTFVERSLMLSICFFVFSILIIGLELFTGFVIIGWTGDNMVVERKRHPGPYWFGIILHVIVAVGLPLLIFFAE